MADAPWQSLYDRVRVVRDGSRVYAPPATDAELDALAEEIGSPLPESYRAWMKRFGPGEFHRSVNLYPIHGTKGCWIWVGEAVRKFRQDWDHHENASFLSSLVYFGDWGTSGLFAWNPNESRAGTSERPFYHLPRHEEDQPVECGQNFGEMLQWAEEAINGWREEIEGLTHAIRYLRRKQRPNRAEVKALLAHDSGTLKRLALALRADPRPAEFGVLADALEEAGCDCADLLASCRPGAHEEDRQWVLDVLLGKAT